MNSVIYFDHAASSFPKPESVMAGVSKALTSYGANPGRGNHRLVREAASVVAETRLQLARFFGVDTPKNVSFHSNATAALNLAIKGFPLKAGDHVAATSFEHNSVRRPLEFLKKTRGIKVTYVRPDLEREWERALQKRPKLAVAVHGSNVTGSIFPIERMAAKAKENGIPFLVDASQTAGILPIHMEETGIDMLAFPGHKGLLGPQGTGVLIFKEGIELEPLMHGGTGSRSDLIEQPGESPERYESGTLNTPGIAGLLAGLQEVRRIGIGNVYEHESRLTAYCMDELSKMKGIRLYGPGAHEKRLPVFSLSLDLVSPQELSVVLDEHYEIAVRAGLHCAPLAHESLGTFPEGTVRVSFGPYNTVREVDVFLKAMEEIKTELAD